MKKIILLMLVLSCLMAAPLLARAASVPVTAVILSETEVRLAPGETLRLEASVEPKDASRKTLRFSSDHPEIAKVGSTGKITAVSPGVAIVRVSATDDSGRIATCRVTVAEAAKPAATPKPTPTPKPPKGSMARVTTASGNLNLRAEAKAHAKPLRQIPKGEEIEVLAHGTEWCYVRYKGTAGFVRTRYLTLGTGVKKSDVAVPAKPDAKAETKATPTPKPTAKATAKPTPTPKATPKVTAKATVKATARPTKTPAPAKKTPLKPGTARVKTTKGGLNLRQAPSSRAARILIIPRGAVVQVVTSGAKWSLVTYNGQTGYVKTQYLGLD